MKKTISLILTVLLLAALLTGCGSTEPAAPETTAQPQTMSVDESGKWTGRGGCCKLEITDGGSVLQQHEARRRKHRVQQRQQPHEQGRRGDR